MEFLRFGSSIPGSYWGCCACCIIQKFNVDPNAKASIQLVDGDGGSPIMGRSGSLFAGPTYYDIFKARIRIGTFSNSEMPNHMFLAVLTHSQLSSTYGQQWLKILKEEGFEFIRTSDNSVYTGAGTISAPGKGVTSSHPNYLFGLFRNIGAGAIENPFQPPKEWTALDDPYGGDMSWENMQKVQLDHWKKEGKPKFLSEAEVVKAGAPVILAGQRSKYPQEEKGAREQKQKAETASKAKAAPAATAAGDPFAPKNTAKAA